MMSSLAKENSKPFITINKLAEYMNANSTRRKQIVQAMKSDKDFRKNRYQIARTAIPKFFRKDYDIAILEKAIAKAEVEMKMPNLTDWVRNDLHNSKLALEALKISKLPDLKDYMVVELDRLEKIELGGVIVSIKPDIYLKNKKTNKIGGVKVHIAKTPQNRLGNNSLEFAGTILQVGFIHMGYSQQEIDNKACFSVDVFDKKYAFSPKAYQRRLESLTNACEEYALRWEAL